MDSLPHPLDWPAPPPSPAVRRLVQINVVRALNSLPRVFSLRDEEKATIIILESLAPSDVPMTALSGMSVVAKKGQPLSRFQSEGEEITEVGSLALPRSQLPRALSEIADFERRDQQIACP
jgi:hypothetical protein